VGWEEALHARDTHCIRRMIDDRITFDKIVTRSRLQHAASHHLRRLPLPPYAHVQIANHIADGEDSNQASEDSHRFGEARAERVVVGDDKLTVPELVDDVQSGESDGGAAECVQESAV